jgi:hypothetical protein
MPAILRTLSTIMTRMTEKIESSNRWDASKNFYGSSIKMPTLHSMDSCHRRNTNNRMNSMNAIYNRDTSRSWDKTTAGIPGNKWSTNKIEDYKCNSDGACTVQAGMLVFGIVFCQSTVSTLYEHRIELYSYTLK